VKAIDNQLRNFLGYCRNNEEDSSIIFVSTAVPGPEGMWVGSAVVLVPMFEGEGCRLLYSCSALQAKLL
jgi:hypothetical protein